MGDGAKRRGLRRSHIFIARGTKNGRSSVGAKSQFGGMASGEKRSLMSLLTELIAYSVAVAIKISLLRS